MMNMVISICVILEMIVFDVILMMNPRLIHTACGSTPSMWIITAVEVIIFVDDMRIVNGYPVVNIMHYQCFGSDYHQLIKCIDPSTNSLSVTSGECRSRGFIDLMASVAISIIGNEYFC